MSLPAQESLPPAPRLGTKTCVAIFLLAFAARLAAIGASGFSNIGFADARAYLGAARSLVETGHYPLRTDAFFFRAPGYPVFLVLCTAGHPGWIPPAKVANAAAGSLSALLLAALSARIFRRRSLAVATGLAASLHPAFVLVSAEIQSEPLFLLLLLTAGYLLLAAMDRPSSGLACLAGLVLALAALTRPSALALVPLLFASLLDRRYPRRARYEIVLSSVAGFLLALSPWILRNALAFHEFIPVNDVAGISIYHGNSVWTRRFYRLHSREEYLRWIAAMDRETREEITALQRSDPLRALHPSRYFLQRAVSEARRDPAGEAALLARKAGDWLRPYPSPWFWPAWVVVTVSVEYSALFVFAAFGLARAERRGVALFCMAVLAISMAVHVAMLVVWRYRVPYWDPVLLLYGLYGGDTLISRWKPPAR